MVAMQSEMDVLSSGSKAEAGGLLLAGSSSTGFPAIITEKGTEADLSISDGDTMVGMEAGGCRSRLHNIDIEVGQYGILSEFDVGEIRKFGGATDKADGEVEGALTLVLESVGLPEAIQSEHYRVEGRKGDDCLGG